MWIFIFTCLYGILGITIDKDEDHLEDGEEYQQMGRFTKLYLFAYRNSMGDMNMPDTTYW